jgi:hypothetical protein
VTIHRVLRSTGAILPVVQSSKFELVINMYARSPPTPANHGCLDAAARIHVVPNAATQSAQERNYVSPDMILAKKLERLVNRWIAFMNESADTLLPCCHCLSISSAVIVSMLTRTAATARPRPLFCCRIDGCFSRKWPDCPTSLR